MFSFNLHQLHLPIAMKFPRFGCVFCAAHSELRSTHNNHLDSLIKEVTNARAIAPALRKGQHFLPVIRAVRRRSGRNKKQRPIAIKTSEYDCCDKWRLFVMIVSVLPFLRQLNSRLIVAEKCRRAGRVRESCAPIRGRVDCSCRLLRGSPCGTYPAPSRIR